MTTLDASGATALAPCCAPADASPLDEQEIDRIARVSKALGDPTRVRLLALISAEARGESCVCDLTEPVGLSQGTVSHHMRILAQAGLVEREQRGKWAYYSIVRETLAATATAMRSL
jgi:ArsR family transcriptional regulator